MKKRHSLMLAAVAVALCSCGTLRPTGALPPQKTASREHSPQTMASYYYTEGLKNSIMGGDPAQSATYFEKVIAIDSTHAPSLFELATLYASTPEKALPYSLKAAQIDTANIWYRSQLGRLLIATQRYDSAMRVYRTLLRDAPDNPDNYRLMAALQEQKGEPLRALAVLDSAESRLGRTAMLSAYKRELLVKLKQFDRALSESRALVADFPYDEENHVALAETYAMLGMDSLAQASYDAALALNPNNTATVVSMNEFYKQRNDNVRFLSTAAQLFRSPDLPLENKLKFYEELTGTPNFYREYYLQIGNLASSLLLTYPGDFRVTELYARHLIAGGDIEEALGFYKARINDSVPNREIFNNIMDIEAYLKRPDSVALYAERALALFPSDPELYLRKGGITSYYLKDYKTADADYREALKYAGSDSLRSVIYGMLGDNSQTTGDYKTAFRHYEKAMKYDTTNAVIYNNYSYYLSLRNERLDKALQMAEKANRLSPGNPTYLDTYAWVLYQLGRYEEARAQIKQAVSLDRTNNKELFIHYGDILYKLNDPFMASFYWKKAQENGYDAKEIEERLKLIEKK